MQLSRRNLGQSSAQLLPRGTEQQSISRRGFLRSHATLLKHRSEEWVGRCGAVGLFDLLNPLVGAERGLDRLKEFVFDPRVKPACVALRRVPSIAQFVL